MVQRDAALDAAFSALADATRRGIVERLGRGEATIGDLATRFGMTLTGIRKHVRVLEGAGLASSRKVGRTRWCRLGRERLQAVAAWIERYRRMQEERLDRLGRFLDDPKGGSA